MDESLKNDIETNILPLYDDFDATHQRGHVEKVIEQSLTIATDHDVDMNMVYVIAAYHDTGLTEGRKTHHLVSGRIVREDMWLRDWFSGGQIETMAQACEDHRASSDHDPRSIYGKINVARLNTLREIIKNESLLRQKFDYLYDTLTNPHLIGCPCPQCQPPKYRKI